MPLAGSRNGGAWYGRQNAAPTGAVGVGWSRSDTSNAAAQYVFYASLTTPIGGCLLDVYA